MASSSAIERKAGPEPSLPDLDALALRHSGRVKPRDLRALHRWLSTLEGMPSVETAQTALETGARWLRTPGALIEAEPALVVRLRLLVEILEDVPRWRELLAAQIGTLLKTGQLMPALESGLPNDRGLGAESADRLARRFLPAADDLHDLGALVSRMFPKRRDAQALSAIPDELAARLAHIIRDGNRTALAPCEQAILDAIALVATRTSALGLSREIRQRSPDVPLAASPFFLLPRLCDALFTGIGSANACRDQIAACREALEAVRAHLDEFGVSVDVVYRLEVIALNLDRLADLLDISVAADPDVRGAAGMKLLARIATARIRDRSVREMLRTNTTLLARKVIEHAGQTGEHYITATPRQWLRMLGSAAGGGFLTGFTIILKYLILWGSFPLFVEGTLASINYAGSFLAMQLFGFTLATKQPSMIAAALAGSLRGSGDNPELDGLVTQIARICRSQLAAALGNVGMVIPTSIAFHLLLMHFKGHSFLDEHAAEHTIESLHPIHSGTIFFAALTGVLLWLSSLGAGWLENWSTYRRLPEAVAQHRLGRIVGRGPMLWLGRVMARNMAGLGGNVSIGFLLGMTPVFGRFFGIPLEVRHITLSTGSLTQAIAKLGFFHPGVGAACGGLAIILALNFGVSFTCALAVALRARGVNHAGRRLVRAILSRFRRDPLPFLLPVEKGATEPAHH
jgi:site-specific recombinase